MLLSEYIKELQWALGQVGDLEVIYSADDEGNHYHSVCSSGEAMYVESLQHHYLEPVDYNDLSEYAEPVKVFCIN